MGQCDLNGVHGGIGGNADTFCIAGHQLVDGVGELLRFCTAQIILVVGQSGEVDLAGLTVLGGLVGAVSHGGIALHHNEVKFALDHIPSGENLVGL